MRWQKYWSAFIGVAIACFVVPLAFYSSETGWYSSRKRLDQLAIQKLAQPHLARADQRVEESTQRHFAGIETLFNESRSNTSNFAKAALGWSSKWRIVADAVPFTSGERNEQFLKEQFETQVLSGHQLEKAVEQAVQEFLDDIRSIESRMLVDLRADVEGFSKDFAIASLDAQEIQSQFDKALEHASRIAGVDLQSNISSQLVSIVVGEVLTQVAIRLGVSAGILGAGAASGWATLGVGVVVGIIIDQIVMTIWNQWSDPKADLVKMLNSKLSTMQGMICYGDEETQGLLQRFEHIAKTRAELRRAAIQEMLESNSINLDRTSARKGNDPK